MQAENDVGKAIHKAKANRAFWTFVFLNGGLSYSDIAAMDLAEFQEATEAFMLWRTVWSKKQETNDEKQP